MRREDLAVILHRASEMMGEEKYTWNGLQPSGGPWLTKDVFIDVLKRLAIEIHGWGRVVTK